ncbi:phage holin [Alkalicoccus chagannorensis]|uniref:phage holin n=1 Tax=Alkalicoccus chagannorensis TaxID=427072 RepID=UPI0004224BD5|nr:phage holin [Alkalicoccus chagannorensis]
MDKGTIIRTTVLALALINQLLASFGMSPLPFTQEEMEQGVSAVVTTAAAIWAWWRDNDVTEEARKRKGKA